MPFPRAELDEMVERWLQANQDCERAGDWRPLAEFYTEDATYGWNYGPKHDFMAMGRNEIRDWAIGFEMDGLDGWTYPYQSWVIDEQTGDMLGLWKQVCEVKRADGTNYALTGIQGSWFQYGGDFQWKWQRDFFDYGNLIALFTEMIGNDQVPAGLQKRIDRVVTSKGRLPGWYRVGTSPVPLW